MENAAYGCTGNKKRLCDIDECKMCFNRSFASHFRSEFWNYELNEDTPRQCAMSKNSKRWFTCDKEGCGHIFETTLSSIANKNHPSWCPYCTNNKLCEDECEQCFEKSFASHPKSEFWNYEYNEDTPRQYFLGSSKKIWFDCNICGHMFEITLSSITNKKSHWCHYCVNQKLCEEECQMCFEKSFASHPRSEFWNYEYNGDTPRQYTIGSGYKRWFTCDKEECGHIFESQLASITNKKRSHWCSYCANKILCNDECRPCFEKSFASHYRSEFWNYEYNEGTPRQYFIGSNDKKWFTCDKEECGHIFESVLCNITNKNKPSWCPLCKNKTEKKLYEFLISNHFDHTRQPKFDWCKNSKTNRHYPFDFLVGNVIIELDGAQHFTQVSNWQDPLITQTTDRYKERQALKNGYSIIRLLQEDVFNDYIDISTDDGVIWTWQDLLSSSLAEERAEPDITLISTWDTWPGFENVETKMIKVTYETVINFVI
jgi:very-short-patch-repair endonuclease